MIDVGERRLAQRPHRLMRDDQHLAPEDGFHPDAVGGELAIGGGVLAQREERRVLVGRDGSGRGDGGVHGGTNLVIAASLSWSKNAN